MAQGYPVKANYATGDVLTAANMNDLAGTVNFAVSSTPTTATQMAGKNAIINGDFGIWQRGTSFTYGTTGYSSYTADRWWIYGYGASATCTQQAFTAGTAPVAGYEGAYFARFNSTTTATFFGQRIEDVRTYAGQQVTLSYWAKSASAQTLTVVELEQNFGSGGSASVYNSFTAPTLTTSWVRYTSTITLPSISGKTIGTSSFLQLDFKGAINNAIDIWGVQLEAGASATPFQTATGTKQGELAACQRYYYLLGGGVDGVTLAAGACLTTTLAQGAVFFPVPMRTTPSLVIATGTNYYYIKSNSDFYNTSLSLTRANNNSGSLYGTFSGLTAGYGAVFYPSNAASSVAFNAEL